MIIFCFFVGHTALNVTEQELESLSPRQGAASVQDVVSSQSSGSLSGTHVSMPKPISDVLKVVYQAKCALIKVQCTLSDFNCLSEEGLW